MIKRLDEKKKTVKEDKLSLIKITKPTAQKMFTNGETVYLLPNKVRLGNQWILPFAISDSTGETFDKILNAYSYYNCNSETGNGIAFYKEA